jgi:CPA1 family monovalent cation:H+ antiporter
LSAIHLAALLVSLAAAFGVINHFLLRLPTTIGLVVIALAVSLTLIGVDALFPSFQVDDLIREQILGIDFTEALMHGMLGFLLFAGALHVDLDALRNQKWAVAAMATVGVLISTAIVGLGFHWITGAPLLFALLFGALISPTDPVAVLGLLKSVKVPHSLETKIAGESLFNDGVAYVTFLALVTLIATDPAQDGELHVAPDILGILRLFVVEVGGGILLGGVAGWLVFQVMRRIDDYALEVLLTLALAMGGYSLALSIGVSAPIAIVVAGLLIGHHGIRFGMSEQTRTNVDAFWRLIDEILNAMLFLLIGFEVFAIEFHTGILLYSLLSIPLALAGRFVAVALPLTALRLRRTFVPGTIPILTWGGLRGGVSVALVLSLPEHDDRDLLLAATYVVVIFSIVVQGLTMRSVVRRFVPPGP